MLTNYIKIAIRNLLKNKSYAFISIFGMSLALAVCIMLLLYITMELSYDKFNEKADNIYRLYQPEHPYQAPQTAKLLTSEFSEIKDFTRVLLRESVIINYNNKIYKENLVAMVDSSFLKIFSYKLIQGNPKELLNLPNSGVISERTAKKYFGNENPIGKIIKVNNQFFVTITGVIENMPINSHLNYDIMVSLSNAEQLFGNEMMNTWGWQNFLVYFEMKENFDKKTLENKISNLLNIKANAGSEKVKYYLQNIKDIHLYSEIQYDIEGKNSITYILIFTGIGILILLIACFNYINLVTANATVRAKEIGIRKVIGASRKHLSTQFIGESIIVLFISFFISITFVFAALPIFNNLIGKELTILSLFNFELILSTLLMIFIIAFLSGFYPAFVLSNIQPIKALKSSYYSGNSKINIRKLLVGVQFIILIVLITAAIFMFKQIDYLEKKELGFDKEYIITSDLFTNLGVEKYKALKYALLNDKNVANVSIASRIPSNQLNNNGGIAYPGAKEAITIPYVHIENDYFELFNMKLKEGRFFSEQYPTDQTEAIIINESALKLLKFKGSPIGQVIYTNWPQAKRKIIGIVKDFHFESLYETIKPAVFVLHFPETFKLIIKLKPSNAKESIKNVTKICQTFYPEEFFDFQFVDELLNKQYRSDINTFDLMKYFTIIAIFISCMGLFGISFFMMKSKTKEIGVRKVLGASISVILFLLTKDFIKWLIIASLIAWPIAYFGISYWIENFAYRIEISLFPFILSGLLAFIIIILTISFQVLKAALANPINIIKYE